MAAMPAMPADRYGTCACIRATSAANLFRSSSRRQRRIHPKPDEEQGDRLLRINAWAWALLARNQTTTCKCWSDYITVDFVANIKFTMEFTDSRIIVCPLHLSWIQRDPRPILQFKLDFFSEAATVEIQEMLVKSMVGEMPHSFLPLSTLSKSYWEHASFKCFNPATQSGECDRSIRFQMCNGDRITTNPVKQLLTAGTGQGVPFSRSISAQAFWLNHLITLASVSVTTLFCPNFCNLWPELNCDYWNQYFTATPRSAHCDEWTGDNDDDCKIECMWRDNDEVQNSHDKCNSKQH